MPESSRGRPRRAAPVLLGGLATAGLVAVAATRPWVRVDDALALTGATGGEAADPTTFPLASAVSLVLLAAWGVLLVTRGRVRRAFAVLAALTALGLVATVVTAALTLPDSAAAAAAEVSGERGDVSYAPWFWVAAIGSLLAVVPAVLAVRGVRHWPEMGTRYDAPAAAAAAPAAAPGPPEVASERELWRSLDDGVDPTDPAPDEPHP